MAWFALMLFLQKYAVQKEIQSQRYLQFQRLFSWTRKYEGLKRQIYHENLQQYVLLPSLACHPKALNQLPVIRGGALLGNVSHGEGRDIFAC